MQLKQAQLGVTMAAYEGVSDDWVKNTDKFNLQPYLDMMNSDIVFRPHSRSTLVWWNMMTTELKRHGQAIRRWIRYVIRLRKKWIRCWQTSKAPYEKEGFLWRRKQI